MPHPTRGRARGWGKEVMLVLVLQPSYYAKAQSRSRVYLGLRTRSLF